MSDEALLAFWQEWLTFLKKKGHQVEKSPGIVCASASRNGSGQRYLWLLAEAQGADRVFSRAEIQNIKCLQGRAREKGKQTFVVIRFTEPIHKVVIVPARRVIKLKRITSSKGGIPWD